MAEQIVVGMLLAVAVAIWAVLRWSTPVTPPGKCTFCGRSIPGKGRWKTLWTSGFPSCRNRGLDSDLCWANFRGSLDSTGDSLPRRWAEFYEDQREKDDG